MFLIVLRVTSLHTSIGSYPIYNLCNMYYLLPSFSSNISCHLWMPDKIHSICNLLEFNSGSISQPWPSRPTLTANTIRHEGFSGVSLRCAWWTLYSFHGPWEVKEKKSFSYFEDDCFTIRNPSQNKGTLFVNKFVTTLVRWPLARKRIKRLRMLNENIFDHIREGGICWD